MTTIRGHVIAASVRPTGWKGACRRCSSFGNRTRLWIALCARQLARACVSADHIAVRACVRRSWRVAPAAGLQNTSRIALPTFISLEQFEAGACLADRRTE